jgi:hypothetical protein
LNPILINGVGVYDNGNDGLHFSHEIGLWRYAIDGSIRFSSTIIPAGSLATLIEGYRYVAIDPVMISPGEGLIVGALYREGDPDAAGYPVSGHFASVFRTANGLGLRSDAPNLSIPTDWVCPGEEGVPCLKFYHVNLLFQVVPEPHVTGLLFLALGGVFFTRR